MFGVETADEPSLVPYGIYTIPEISMVGSTEQQLTSARIPKVRSTLRHRAPQ